MPKYIYIYMDPINPYMHMGSIAFVEDEDVSII